MNPIESFFAKKPKFVPLATAGALAFFVLLALLERFHVAGEPWFCDINFYAAMGREMLRGRFLYSDLWDDRPPATYVTFAAAEKLLGPGSDLILWMGFWASAAILLGLYFAGRGLSGKRTGGLLAAGLFALISTEVYLEADQPNTEIFMNACTVWAFALLVWPWKKKTPFWAYAVAGLLWGWAALYKQFMAVEGIGLGLAYWLSAPKGGERTRAGLGVALAWGTALAVGAATCAYFFLTGRWGIFWDTLFTYGGYYSGNVVWNLLTALEPQYLFPGWLWFALPLALLTLVAPFLAWDGKRRWALVYSVFLLLKFLEKAFPGRLIRHHYYQLWIPALCLGAGWALVLLWERSGKKAVALPWTAGCLALLFIVLHQAAWFRLPWQEWIWSNYGRDYDGVDQVVQQVSLVLKPNEDFYEWSEYPRFYYACGRRVPVGVLFGIQNLGDWGTYSGGPLAGELTRRTLEDLQKDATELVIRDKYWPPPGFEDHPVNAYLKSHYRAFAAFGPHGRYEFWCRVGGDLDQRLKPAAGS